MPEAEGIKKTRCAAIVLAGGTGSRMQQGISGADTANVDAARTKKQFRLLDGKPLICHSLAVFAASVLIDDIILVTGAEDVTYCEKEIVAAYGFSGVRQVVAGGKERYHSVYAGLCALREVWEKEAALHAPEESRLDGYHVLIHDGARPFVTEEIIGAALEGAKKNGAAVAAVPVRDTIKFADNDRFVTDTPDRRSLYAMQTPQAFSFSLAYDAYDALIAEEKRNGPDGDDFLQFLARLTDDAMVVERYFPEVRVFLSEGHTRNFKITAPEDLWMAEAVIAREKKQS